MCSSGKDELEEELAALLAGHAEETEGEDQEEEAAEIDD